MEKYFYFVITPNAKIYRAESIHSRILKLDELQKAVQGYIETVRSQSDELNCTPYKVIGLVNEEGRLQGLADNPIGSMVLSYPVPLCGNVVILQVDGEELIGFNEKEADAIGRHIYHTRNLYAGYFSPGDGGALQCC